MTSRRTTIPDDRQVSTTTTQTHTENVSCHSGTMFRVGCTVQSLWSFLFNRMFCPNFWLILEEDGCKLITCVRRLQSASL